MRYKLAVFDVDGTLTRHISSWQYIHEKFGLWSERACEYQDMFMRGEISYRRFCELDAGLWKGVPEDKISRIFTRRLYSRNAISCLKRLKSMGFKLALISTGLQYMARIIKQDVDPDIIICNSLVSSDGILTGGVRLNIGHNEKGEKLKDIIRQFKLKKHQVISVGDGRGDVPMAEHSGYSIAFNSDDAEYLETVDYACCTKDFNEVYEHILKINGDSC